MPLIDYSLVEFTSLLASPAPAPGGGAAAALEGALGAALINMVGALTAGKKKYAEHAGFVERLNERAQAMRKEFLRLIDEDAAAFNKIGDAYKMPKDTAEEKAARKAAIQSTLKLCVSPPAAMLSLCEQAADLTAQALGKTNANVASDLGVAALCLKAAAQSAWLNVAVNLAAIDDEQFCADCREKGEATLARTISLADNIYMEVMNQIVMN